MYLSRTIPGISDMLIPIDNAINTHFIPSLTGRDSISDLERKLLALSPRLGGLGITIPSEESIFEHSSSVKVCAPLVALIVQQIPTFSASTIFDQQQEKQRVRQLRRLKQKDTAQQLKQELPRHLRRAKELGSEKGASSWLTALPIKELGFALHKGDFQDALCLRYGWQPTNIPSKCACGTSFSVDHALCCKKGGFPTHRHNEIRDFTASVLTEVCHDVCTEPPLQELAGEPLPYATSNREDRARLDIRAQSFWGDRFQRAFFDVRVFYPNAPSYRNLQLSSVYRRHENEKK